VLLSEQSHEARRRLTDAELPALPARHAVLGHSDVVGKLGLGQAEPTPDLAHLGVRHGDQYT
jgi:hypothetical protein